MRHLWDRSYGLGRSLGMYYGKPWRAGRHRRFYRQFIRRGDLCFDLGAHVGSRSRCWSALGARVVAVEPQPDLHRLLRVMFAFDSNITVVPNAVAARSGAITLHLSPRTPTVSSGSTPFMTEAATDPSFAWVRWSRQVEVPATTLDLLSQRFGRPDFVKIDVEGMEHEVLRGVSFPPRILSFEFVPASPPSALLSIDRLEELGRYRFIAALGESMAFVHDRWLDASAMRSWLISRAADTGSGDVYARLADA